MMYISGSGKYLDNSASLRVSRVFFIGKGRKNMVPLHALSELYVGTFFCVCTKSYNCLVTFSKLNKLCTQSI